MTREAYEAELAANPLPSVEELQRDPNVAAVLAAHALGFVEIEEPAQALRQSSSK